MRFPRGSYFDDDDDSGADSLGNELMNGGQHCGHYQQPPPPLPRHQSRALVPYGSGSCCMRQYHHQQHQCCSPTPSNTSIPSTALQVMPGVEERLLQLEGDKDSLHMQVNISHCTWYYKLILLRSSLLKTFPFLQIPNSILPNLLRFVVPLNTASAAWPSPFPSSSLSRFI